MSGQRYSITPARAVADRRLTDFDFRLLALYGTHADKSGWCFLNQARIAERLGVARQSVCRSTTRLAELGYIERRDINSTRVESGRAKRGPRSINSYRVIMDAPCGPEPETADALYRGAYIAASSPQGDLSPQGDNGVLSPAGDTCCPATVTPVVTDGRQLNDPIRTIPLERTLPPTPSGGVAAATESATTTFSTQEAPKVTPRGAAAEEHGQDTYGARAEPLEAPKPKRTPKARNVAPRYTPEFEAFWQSYLRKTAKTQAFAAWGRLSEDDQRAAAAAVPLFFRSRSDWGQDYQFVPHASTFLNQRRFDDFREYAKSNVIEASGRFSSSEESALIQRIQAFDKDPFFWTDKVQRRFGPAPGRPGCTIPEEIIARARAS